jgi:hypothetical protein
MAYDMFSNMIGLLLPGWIKRSAGEGFRKPILSYSSLQNGQGHADQVIELPAGS